MANILNCRAIFLHNWKHLKAEALNFGVLMDCSNQEYLKKLKGRKVETQLSVYKSVHINSR